MKTYSSILLKKYIIAEPTCQHLSNILNTNKSTYLHFKEATLFGVAPQIIANELNAPYLTANQCFSIFSLLHTESTTVADTKAA